MNVSNAVYQFIENAVGAAASGSPLFDFAIHESLYEHLTAEKTARVGDVTDSEPRLVMGETKLFNASLTVQLVVRPVNDSPAQKRAARDKATEAAKEIARLIFEDERLSDSVCDCRVERMANDWAKPGSIVYAVAGLLLIINSK